MANNIFVFDEKVKDELIKKGYRYIEKREDVNGETVWVLLNPNGLFFDIDKSDCHENIVFDTGIKLTF